MNKQISTLILDKIVWDKVLAILMNPMALEEGYEQAVETQKQNMSRKIVQVETLERALVKVKTKRQNLNNAYLDPDIQMSKVEYLDQKECMDKEAHSIEEDLERLRQELATLPQPADLEALKRFSAEIARGLLLVESLTLERKRQKLELMHVKVIYHPDGQVELNGWSAIPGLEFS